MKNGFRIALVIFALSSVTALACGDATSKTDFHQPLTNDPNPPQTNNQKATQAIQTARAVLGSQPRSAQ